MSNFINRIPFPVSYDCLINHNQKNINNRLEIIIKPELLDTSNVKEGDGLNKYRPKNLDEYIGQENIKGQLKDYIQGCKDFNETMPHIFISSPPGYGKTLLANIIANTLNKKIVKCTAGELKSEQQFVDKINDCDGGIIFLDESNRLSKRLGFFMLPIIELFEIHNKKIRPFTMIFATTHIGDLAKDLDALIQRCDLQFKLEHYNEDELVLILKQYLFKQYVNIKVDEIILLTIARNCRLTPRIAISLLRNYIFNRNWERVKKNHGIINDGLTNVDIQILKYLNQYPKGVGQNTIANYLRIKPQTYIYEYEPYLIFKELIVVENRRKITEKGQHFINQRSIR